MKERLKELAFKIDVGFEESHAFMAVRQGLIMMIPLISLGSVALMIKSLPIAAYQAVLPELFGGRLLKILSFIQGGTINIFSVLLSITTSVSYAMIRDVKERSERAVVYDCFILAIITLCSFMGYAGIQGEDFSVSSLGTMNTFMALVIALVSGWLYFKVRNSKILNFLKKPGTDVAGMYYIAVQSIIPAAIVVGLFALADQLFQVAFHVDHVQEGIIFAIDKILSCFKGGFSAGLAILFFIHSLWFFGIHGSNVVDPVIQKYYTAIDGVAIYNKTFQDVFVIMGGCGAALSIVIAILIFSKKKMMKNVAKLALPGVVCNISEVIVFGLPIIFNPIFLVPFIMVPLMNYVVSYGAVFFGLVPRVIHQVEWTTPIILSGYSATGSFAGSILQIVCLVLDILIYLPFIRLFELHSDKNMIRRVNMLVALLQEEEETKNTTSLIGREDMLGSIARILASDLRIAIEKKELFMLYQPQVNEEEKCVGAEALLRWNHPVVGMVYPPLIVRLAKEAGVLSKMEEIIFDTSASALSKIEKATENSFKLSVNITNESLLWDGFEKMVDESVKRYRISRENLWLEITEQDALSSSVDISEKMDHLKKKGHKLLIDDFGMGHTSLLYLQTSNFEIVKIDGRITRDAMHNDRYRDIIKSIVYLGNLLNFMTVAEFVETKEQAEMLKNLGVDAFQGYYYSMPVTLEELIDWIKKHE